MPNIKRQKLIYHLTSLENMPGILEHGLLPRSQLQNFQDVADQEIIASRRNHCLENFVPFHWFSRNPFDGRVQADRPDEDFALITIHRELAQRENWKLSRAIPWRMQCLNCWIISKEWKLSTGKQ